MAKRRVLIITYYWPPSGGGGVQRWLKMTKYLPEFGWHPVVYTPDNPFVNEKDSSLLGDIPDSLEVIKQFIWEPYALTSFLRGSKNEIKQGVIVDESKQGLIEKFMIWVRGNLLIPDPRLFWVKPSVKRLSHYLEKNPVDLIVTTGPPHSMHLIGLGLKRRFHHIKWIADFRDPWSNWDMLKKLVPGRNAWNKHLKMENRVLKTADMVMTVSKTWAKDFKLLGASKTCVITNGFDARDFDLKQEPKPIRKNVISHFGLLNEFRNYPVLWKALDYLAGTGLDFELRLGGIIDGSVLNSLYSYNYLKSRIKLMGYLKHEDIIEQYQQSSLLLLLTNNSDNAKGHLPGKFFEYVGSRRPIFALGDVKSEIAQLIKDHQLGHMHGANNEDEIALATALAHLLAEGLQQIGDHSQFDRRNITGRMSIIFNNLILQKS